MIAGPGTTVALHCLYQGCDREFASEQVLADHQIEAHGAAPGSYACRSEGCELVFGTSAARAGHEFVGHRGGKLPADSEPVKAEKPVKPEKPQSVDGWVCGQGTCERVFRTEHGRAVHVRRTHAEPKPAKSPTATELEAVLFVSGPWSGETRAWPWPSLRFEIIGAGTYALDAERSRAVWRDHDQALDDVLAEHDELDSTPLVELHEGTPAMLSLTIEDAEIVRDGLALTIRIASSPLTPELARQQARRLELWAWLTEELRA